MGKLVEILEQSVLNGQLPSWKNALTRRTVYALKDTEEKAVDLEALMMYVKAGELFDEFMDYDYLIDVDKMRQRINELSLGDGVKRDLLALAYSFVAVDPIGQSYPRFSIGEDLSGEKAGMRTVYDYKIDEKRIQRMESLLVEGPAGYEKIADINYPVVELDRQGFISDRDYFVMAAFWARSVMDLSERGYEIKGRLPEGWTPLHIGAEGGSRTHTRD